VSILLYVSKHLSRSDPYALVFTVLTCVALNLRSFNSTADFQQAIRQAIQPLAKRN